MSNIVSTRAWSFFFWLQSFGYVRTQWQSRGGLEESWPAAKITFLNLLGRISEAKTQLEVASKEIQAKLYKKTEA